LLEQLFFPPRLLFRAFDDIHRMADAAVSVAATMRSLRQDMDALRVAFAGADAELEDLRKAFVPEARGIHRAARALHEDVENITTLLGALDTDVKDMGHRLTSEVASLHATIQVLVREADDMRQVVEPLQSATERVGRVADRLPGGGS
jgi:uncharacterized protein YoxC